MAGPSKPFNPNPGHKKRLRPGLQVPQMDGPEFAELQQFLGTLAEYIEQGDGNRGQPEQRFVTAQDLKDAGIADLVVKNRRVEIGQSAAQVNAGVEATRAAVLASIPALAQLTDTEINNPIEGDGLVYAALINKWVNAPAAAGASIAQLQFAQPGALVPPASIDGLLYWDERFNAPAYFSDIPTAPPIVVGHDQIVRVFNDEALLGNTFEAGNVVYVTGEVDGVPSVVLAQADALATSRVLGIVMDDITPQFHGYVMRSGTLIGVDTSAFVNGDLLFLSAVTPGLLTTTVPTDSTQFVVPMGRVMERTLGVPTPQDGIILVDIKTGQREANESVLFSSTIKRLSADAGGIVTLFSDTDTETEDRYLQGQFQDGTPMWRIGNVGDDDLNIHQQHISGSIEIIGTSIGPVTEVLYRTVAGGGTSIGGEGVTFFLGNVDDATTIGRISSSGSTEWYSNSGGQFKRISTQTSGRVFIHSDLDLDTDARGIEFAHQDGTTTGFFNQAIGNMQWRNEVVSGTLAFTATDAGSVVRTGLAIDPNSLTTLFAAGNIRLSANLAGGVEIAVECIAGGAVILAHNGIDRLATSAATVGVSIKSDTSADNVARGISFEHQDGTQRAFLRQTILGEIHLRNIIPGSDVVFDATNAGSTTRNFLRSNPDGELLLGGATDVRITTAAGTEVQIDANAAGSVILSYAGVDRIETAASGVVLIKSDTDTDAEIRELVFAHQDGTSRGFIGHNGSVVLSIRNEIHGGSVIIEAEDAAGFILPILVADPDTNTTLTADVDLLLVNAQGTTVFDAQSGADTSIFAVNDVILGNGTETFATFATDGAVALYEDNVETAHTAAIANGGLEVSQSITASGFERVMTVSDNRKTGTFTPTWGAAGFSTDPTGDLRWQIISASDGTDGWVIISDDTGAAMTGTSDNANWTMTGLPAAVQPAVNVETNVFVVLDAGFLSLGQATITTAGAITFKVILNTVATTFINPGAASWQASGNKGFPAGAAIMYPLILNA